MTTGSCGSIDGRSRCDDCGKETPYWYTLQYYLLPSRLADKRRRAKARRYVHCGGCYARVPVLVLWIGDRAVFVDKRPGGTVPQSCLRCGAEFAALVGLHGMVVSTFAVDGAIVGGSCLGALCGPCAETYVVELTLPPLA